MIVLIELYFLEILKTSNNRGILHFIDSTHLNSVWIQCLPWKPWVMHEALKHIDRLQANADAWNYLQLPYISILHVDVFSDRQRGISCKSGNLKNKESSVLKYVFAGSGHMIYIKSQLFCCHKVYSTVLFGSELTCWKVVPYHKYSSWTDTTRGRWQSMFMGCLSLNGVLKLQVKY